MRKIKSFNDKVISIPNEVYNVIMKARENENIRAPRAEIEALQRFKSVEVVMLDTAENAEGVVETQWAIDEKAKEFKDGGWEDGETIEILYSID